jgi:hypothetical protein
LRDAVAASTGWARRADAAGDPEILRLENLDAVLVRYALDPTL